jgi:hypothetical protein
MRSHFESGLPAAVRPQDQNGCATLRKMECVSGDRLASALAMRRGELWDTNFRLAERIEMRIKDAQRAHRQATARLRKPRAVCLRSTLSYQRTDEHAGGAVLECLEIGESSALRMPWYLQWPEVRWTLPPLSAPAGTSRPPMVARRSCARPFLRKPGKR